MSRENVEVVRRAIAAFASEGTSAPLEGLVAEDVELRPAFEVVGGTVYVGREGTERFMREWTEAFDDWTFEAEELFEAGDAVAARMRQSARGKGSGAPVGLEFGAVFRLRDGLIVRIELYMTSADALEAAGLEA